MPKVFHCSKCGGQYKRLVGIKCQVMGETTSSILASTSDQNLDENTSSQILNALNAVNYRLATIKQRIDRTEEQLQGQVQSDKQAGSSLETSTIASDKADQNSDIGDDAVIPTIKHLKTSKHIQEAVDLRLQELAKINEQGKFRSQRSNNDQVTAKHQVPRPQNHVLAGTSKARITYDSLSNFQWMAGFLSIIREEKSTEVKNAMLDYMSDLMDDAQDFGWASAKGAHALILYRMEEGKVDWLSPEKLDHLRRAHAQKVLTSNTSNAHSSKSRNDTQGVLCKYFQSGKCSQKSEHTTNGQLYKHHCSHCHTLGNKLPHALKDCRNKRQQDAKKRIRYCSFAVPKKCNSNHKVTTISALASPRFKSRTIYNSTKQVGESSNWKADCYRYKNLTYAEVLSLGSHKHKVSVDDTRQLASKKNGKNHSPCPLDTATNTYKVPRDKNRCVKHQYHVAHPKVSGNPVSKNDSNTVNIDTAGTVPRDKIISQR